MHTSWSAVGSAGTRCGCSGRALNTQLIMMALTLQSASTRWRRLTSDTLAKMTTDDGHDNHDDQDDVAVVLVMVRVNNENVFFMQLLMVEVKMKTQSVCIDAPRGLVEELSVWRFPSPMAAARVLPWAIWQARHPALAQTIRAPPTRQRHGCYRERKMCRRRENGWRPRMLELSKRSVRV